MKILLSAPQNLQNNFHEISRKPQADYFCTSDPAGHKLGSGGGTTWLLEQCAAGKDFGEWLKSEKRVLIHAGGQSRRLPSYAALGKSMLPVPVFRWSRGQRIDQTLLDLQLPLLEKIMKAAPSSMHTLIANGDVLIRATAPLVDIPEVDVACYGIWADPEIAKNHGTFFIDRNRPDALDFMLQKPSPERVAELSQTHFCLMDIGLWLLSDRAVELLRAKSHDGKGGLCTYDLYSQFGCALGQHPSCPDSQLASLSVAILPLEGGEFYHFGASREMLSSTLALQNIVKDQRLIIQKYVKRQPSVFTQNSMVETNLLAGLNNVWIENSCVSAGWHLSSRNIVTGVPVNNWNLSLLEGQCLDITPMADSLFSLRPYGYNDLFRGAVGNADTTFLEHSLLSWLEVHGLTPEDIGGGDTDIQDAPLFPVCDIGEIEALAAWMLSWNPCSDMCSVWKNARRVSANQIAAEANLSRLCAQKKEYLKANVAAIARNYNHSVFYQTDLKDMARRFSQSGLDLPPALPTDAPQVTQIHDAMFRSQYERYMGKDGSADEARAFGLLRSLITAEAASEKVFPRLDVCKDQIVWGRSAVRIDLAGGWTDTPPYCLMSGGHVLNMAIELNGQQPLQVYVKPAPSYNIVCRSIDLGASEVISSFDDLRQYNKVGSPFSIPKAALCLCGFLPEFASTAYPSLASQLEDFGCGLEITLLSAIPAGSGLGTSSILAATVLGALSDFCGLGWDKSQICNRTLMLEQLLTTGGGWQDQYGGVLHGVKLLSTSSGISQTPVARWSPTMLFRGEDYRPCHLLYYTGMTRTAKGILAEIVRGMFLNANEQMRLLGDMGSHAVKMFDVVQRGGFEEYGRMVRTTWNQNKALDAGTEPLEIRDLCNRIDDLCLGYKLPGAGGGGYLYMVAKDPEAALRIRRVLTENPPSANARFVEMDISNRGLQVSRS